jgi:hypothetical protein
MTASVNRAGLARIGAPDKSDPHKPVSKAELLQIMGGSEISCTVKQAHGFLFCLDRLKLHFIGSVNKGLTMKKFWRRLILVTSTRICLRSPFANESSKDRTASNAADTIQDRGYGARPTNCRCWQRSPPCDGMSLIPANPNIAGMPPQYIAKQLEHFKNGV